MVCVWVATACLTFCYLVLHRAAEHLSIAGPTPFSIFGTAERRFCSLNRCVRDCFEFMERCSNRLIYTLVHFVRCGSHAANDSPSPSVPLNQYLIL